MMDQKQTLEPPVPVDEGWWESVLAEEQRAAVFSPRLPKPGARRRAALDAPKNREVERRSERAAKSAAPADKPSADWPHIRRLFHADEIVRLAVTGSNRGGLLVEGDGLFGFVPFSHLIELSGSEPADRDKALGAYVGRTLQLKVIECVPEDGRVVFSERAAQAEPGRRSRIFDTLQPGQTAR
ncbi:MAG: S1 RNA-binding domain-containing protein, partial [Anaerolineales bacterium]|nr:S1 RNA-binding domain-containing protein [Anaerolineales bacterium]